MCKRKREQREREREREREFPNPECEVYLLNPLLLVSTFLNTAFLTTRFLVTCLPFLPRCCLATSPTAALCGGGSERGEGTKPRARGDAGVGSHGLTPRLASLAAAAEPKPCGEVEGSGCGEGSELSEYHH